MPHLEPPEDVNITTPIVEAWTRMSPRPTSRMHSTPLASSGILPWYQNRAAPLSSSHRESQRRKQRRGLSTNCSSRATKSPSGGASLRARLQWQETQELDRCLLLDFQPQERVQATSLGWLGLLEVSRCLQAYPHL